MNGMPRGLLGAAALFWGVQAGVWPVGLAAGLLLEAPHWLRARVEVDLARQRRIGDLCVVLALMVGVACYVAYGNPRAIVLLFQWLPVILLPLGLLQAWGRDTAIRLDVLFMGLRRMAPEQVPSVALGYPYLVAWLVGAAAANRREQAAAAGFVLLGAWALAAARRPRGRWGLWLAELAVAAAAGTALHVGLNQAQQWLEGAAPEWLLGDGGTRTNPYRASTDMGATAALKQSDAVVLRVRPPVPLDKPLLLHRASYEEYAGTSWLARGTRFAEVQRGAVSLPWVLRAPAASGEIEIAEMAPHGNPVLSLPAGAVTVAGQAASLKRNTLGAVQAEAPPGWFRYVVGVAEAGADAAPPGPADLRLPARERPAIDAAVRAFGLAGVTGRDAEVRIRQGFAAGYRYSLEPARVPEGRTPLAHFLEASRAGHCEFFASATVLLLRAAGVPARYATGYSVQPDDGGQGVLLVRERHAHAWARAWLDGAWVDIDTTPPGWAAAEDLERPALRRWRTAFADAWSALRYRYAHWQETASETEKWTWFGGIGVGVLAWLVWRVWGGRRRGGGTGALGAAGPPASRTRVGRDSPFEAVVAALTARCGPRPAHESLAEWVGRLVRDVPDLPHAADLPGLVFDHYRLRFDPEGLPPADLAAFERACARCLPAF